MTDRITIKLQLTGKSRLILNFMAFCKNDWHIEIIFFDEIFFAHMYNKLSLFLIIILSLHYNVRFPLLHNVYDSNQAFVFKSGKRKFHFTLGSIIKNFLKPVSFMVIFSILRWMLGFNPLRKRGQSHFAKLTKRHSLHAALQGIYRLTAMLKQMSFEVLQHTTNRPYLIN